MAATSILYSIKLWFCSETDIMYILGGINKVKYFSAELIVQLSDPLISYMYVSLKFLTKY